MLVGGRASGLLCESGMYGELILPFSDAELLARDLLLLVTLLFRISLYGCIPLKPRTG